MQLFDNANNYDASDELLYAKLFGKKYAGVKLILEYTNMILQCGGVGFLNEYPKDLDSFQRLSEFYHINSTLPLREQKLSSVYSEK